MKIIEIREEYPEISEEDLFEACKKSSQYPTSNLYGFSTEWNDSADRPYDDFVVEVMVFYFKTSDSPIYRMSVTKTGSLKVDEKQSIPSEKGNNEYVKKYNYTMYKGVFVRDTDIMLEWGLQKNMIRSQDPQELGDVEFPISLYMYNAYEMRNLAIPEKVEEPVDALILTRLKIQHIIATMSPPGNAYDITGMSELDLGTGKMFNPLELKKLKHQTGDWYFRSKDAEGNTIDVPIRPMPNSEGLSQLQALIATYNHHLQVFRDEVGINENSEGQSAKPRVTNDNYQASLQVSFNATDYMQRAYLYLLEDCAKKIGCLLHDSVSYSAKQYRKILNEKEVKGRVFSTKFQMLPSEEEQAYINGMVQQALATNPTFILYCDPFHIRNLAKDNVKLASIYFRRAQKRAIEGEMSKAQQQSEMNAKIQVESAKATAESQKEVLDMEAQIKKQQVELEGINANKTAVIAMFTQLFSKGVGIPVPLQALSAAVIQSVMVPLMIQNEEMQKQIIAQMQADQETAMQQEEIATEQGQEPVI